MSVRREILDAAACAVCGERNLNYGAPEDNFRNISELWDVWLKGRRTVEPWEVAVLMIFLKLGRLKTTPDHRDSWVDIAGYAACGFEVAADDPKKAEVWR
jgi:hypothetical protein